MTNTDDSLGSGSPASEQASPIAPASPAAARRWFRERFGDPSAVYGLIVYTTLIAGVSEKYSETWQVLLVSVASLLVFFLAHVFAHTLAAHGRLALGAAVGHGMRHSAGMLYAAVPSTAVLVTGMTEGYDAGSTVVVALIVAMIVLFALGYSAYAERGARPGARWAGAFGAAFLGFIVFLLEYLNHGGGEH